MPVPHVDIQNGSVTGGSLTAGCDFQWSNPTGAQVTLTNCGGFCTQVSYTVPANGTTDAKLKASPTSYDFTDPAWNAPGMPRITVGADQTAEREVA